MNAKDAPQITGLTANSQAVQPGYLFAAIAGLKHDGLDYLEDALAKGAAAVLSRPDPRLQDLNVPVVLADNPRLRLAQLCARYYAPMPQQIVAVTGTNGKSSVVHFCQQLWQLLGISGVSLGTLGVGGAAIDVDIAHTTPDPETLYQALGAIAAKSIQHVALEASSHGLDQYRLHGLQVQQAAFTSFSRDHLDYHRDADDYLQAKLKLFSELLVRDGSAVVNRDCDCFDQVAAAVARRGSRLITYGQSAQSDYRIDNLTPEGDGQNLTLSFAGQRVAIKIPLAGAFQAENLTAAIALLAASGIDSTRIFPVLPALKGVPGRLQHIGTSAAGGQVYVDYSHTPAGLQVALQALRPHCRGRLIVAFGAGGDRDPGKRPHMGAAAAALADKVIVTDDNPRSEDPAAIREAILTACPAATEIADRGHAIAAGIAELQAMDCFLIAGKGHESGQIIGDEVIPFNDAEVARVALLDQGGQVL